MLEESWCLTNCTLPHQLHTYSMYISKIYKHTHIRILVTPLPASLRFLPCLCDSFSQPPDSLLISDIAIFSVHFCLLPSAPLFFQKGRYNQPRQRIGKCILPEKEPYLSLWGRSINSIPLLQCMNSTAGCMGTSMKLQHYTVNTQWAAKLSHTHR